MLVDTEFNYVELDNLKKQPKLWVETIVFIILFPPIVGIASKVHSIIGFVTANLYLLLVVIFFARKFDKITQFNETVLATFAQQNNSTFQKIVDDDCNSYSGSIFQIGHSKRASYLMRQDDTDLPFKFYTYNYKTGSGKSKRSYKLQVMEITLPRKLPHMVIDSLVEDGNSSGSSTLPITFDSSQKISLEGDFHKYFDLYAPDTYGVSALTVLAPDAMEILMRYAVLCDIEIIDNKMYFYWSKIAITTDDYKQMFGCVYAVLKELRNKLIGDDIFSTPSQARVHTAADTTGARLERQKLRWGALTGIFIFILYMGARIESQFRAWFIIASAIMIAGMLILAIFKGIRRRRLKDEILKRYMHDNRSN